MACPSWLGLRLQLLTPGQGPDSILQRSYPHPRAQTSRPTTLLVLPLGWQLLLLWLKNTPPHPF